MASAASQIAALHAALSQFEETQKIELGTTEILPVCETAAGLVEVRAKAAACPRARCALLGAEDLAADLCAERQPDAIELDYARRRFLLECRAAGCEPVDAAYTFADCDGAAAQRVKRVSAAAWAIAASRWCGRNMQPRSTPC